jgi:guanine deaminase
MVSIYYGSVVNPISPVSYQTLLNCLIAVTRQGDIEWMVDGVEATAIQDILVQKGCPETTAVVLADGEFIIPGFIDTHTVGSDSCPLNAFLCHLVWQHAPQVPNIGRRV